MLPALNEPDRPTESSVGLVGLLTTLDSIRLDDCLSDAIIANGDIIFQQSTRILSVWNPIGRTRLIRLRKHFCDPRCAKMKLSYRRNTVIEPLGCPQDFVFKPFQCDLFRLSGTNQPPSPSDIAQLCKHSLAHEYCIRDFLIRVCG